MKNLLKYFEINDYIIYNEINCFFKNYVSIKNNKNIKKTIFYIFKLIYFINIIIKNIRIRLNIKI